MRVVSEQRAGRSPRGGSPLQEVLDPYYHKQQAKEAMAKRKEQLLEGGSDDDSVLYNLRNGGKGTRNFDHSES